MLPCKVRVTTVPLPKSILTRGTGRTDSQALSKFWLMKPATSSRENNTVLAKRAFVQQNRWSSLPIIWNSNTGLPDFLAASQAAAKVACHRTLPGATRGLVAGAEVARAPGAGAVLARAISVGSSIEPLLMWANGCTGPAGDGLGCSSSTAVALRARA